MKLAYKAPDDKTFLFDPTPEQLIEIIRNTSFEYWQQGGNGEAEIDVIADVGDTLPIRCRLQRRDGSEIAYVKDEPSLWIKKPEASRFFFTWNCGGSWWVPYDGDPCNDFVLDERGGDPFPIPRACLVDRDKGAEIVRQFVQSRERSGVVNWIAWDQLLMNQ